MADEDGRGALKSEWQKLQPGTGRGSGWEEVQVSYINAEEHIAAFEARFPAKFNKVAAHASTRRARDKVLCGA